MNRDWPTEMQRTADHLAAMYAVPATRGHALWRLRELEQGHAFSGIAKLVPAEMREAFEKLQAKKEATA